MWNIILKCKLWLWPKTHKSIVKCLEWVNVIYKQQSTEHYDVIIWGYVCTYICLWTCKKNVWIYNLKYFELQSHSLRAVVVFQWKGVSLGVSCLLQHPTDRCWCWGHIPLSSTDSQCSEAGPKFPPQKCVKWLRRTLSFLGKAALEAARGVEAMSRTPSQTYGVASMVSSKEECIMVDYLVLQA